jgi:two-component system, sensor histidine kinase and response regulator
MTAPLVTTSTTSTLGDILIVDDTPANLDVLSNVLTERGYKVRAAINGELALRAITKAPPDLILLDVQMPGLSGFEVCQRLKSDPRTQDIPVIFISVSDAVEEKVRAFEVGGIDYVTKPFQVREVLARVESQMRIQHQRRRIEMLNAFKDELVGIVSHDLKNPIGVVLGYIDLIRDSLAEGNSIDKEMLDRMHKATESMLHLVRDLLDNAQNEQKIPLRMTTVDLNTLVQDCVSMFEYQASQKPVELTAKFADGSVTVQADSRRLTQVINNLISNAIKYSPPNSSISVRTMYDKRGAVIEVADSGYGIPAADLPHIFERFYRVQSKKHLAAEGTGLGLPIAKLIVEEHGGTLTASSSENVGSVFTITLPS